MEDVGNWDSEADDSVCEEQEGEGEEGSVAGFTGHQSAEKSDDDDTIIEGKSQRNS